MIPRAASSALSAACDRSVAGGLTFLIVFAPFAFGAVHPVSYGMVEGVAFALVLAWGLRMLVDGTVARRLPVPPARLWAPLAGLLALVAFQLLPLPPAVLRVISPATYELYRTALPGWPERAPYAEALETALAADAPGSVGTALPIARLPSEREAERRGLEPFLPPGWERVPGEPLFTEAERSGLERGLHRSGGFATWRPLSIAPARTRAALTKLLAYLAIFAVVVGYPAGSGRDARRRFQRRLLRTLVVVAFAVAAVGLLQRFSWNGRILWFFVPWDWGQARLANAQTSGPFVNRNHFASYSGLLLPLALVAALFPGRVVLVSGRRARLGLGAMAATIATALLWSLSRGGWLSALAGVLLCLGLLRRRAAASELPAFLRDPRAALGVAGLGAGIAVAFALMPVSGLDPSAPGNDIDLRLEQTLASQASWEGRVATWRDSVPMLAAHPVFGVGLGAWGAAFPHYDSSPRQRSQAHRAHNDYLQLLCETGALGILLSAAVLWQLARRLGRTLSGPSLPIAAAATSGICALLLHEVVDFGLQIPAIAVTSAILVGVAVGAGGFRRTLAGGSERRAALAVLAAAGCGLALVVTRPARLEPLPDPQPVLRALAEAEAFPASVRPRLDLASRLSAVSLQASRAVLESAVFLDPQAPRPRDALAAALSASGEEGAALAQIEESVARAPYRPAHPYLAAEVARWLSPEQSAAVERGLLRALPRCGVGAAVSLASFRRDRAAWASAAEAWQWAAQRAPSDRARADHLENAGLDFARGGLLGPAGEALEKAIALDPTATRGYEALMIHVLAPRGELDAAAALARRAVDAGADPYEIELALAEAGRRAGDTAAERRALARAIALRPEDARGYLALGVSHYRKSEWARAAVALQRAVAADPSRPEAWYYLGVSEERLYHFEKARRAFEASLRAAPESEEYRRNLQRFTERIRASR